MNVLNINKFTQSPQSTNDMAAASSTEHRSEKQSRFCISENLKGYISSFTCGHGDGYIAFTEAVRVAGTYSKNTEVTIAITEKVSVGCEVVCIRHQDTEYSIPKDLIPDACIGSGAQGKQIRVQVERDSGNNIRRISLLKNDETADADIVDAKVVGVGLFGGAIPSGPHDMELTMPRHGSDNDDDSMEKGGIYFNGRRLVGTVVAQNAPLQFTLEVTPNESKDIIDLIECVEKKKLSHGHIYSGQVLRCKETSQVEILPHGHGKMIYHDGEYDGKFVYGNRQGQGVRQYKDGRKYVGGFSGNYRSGDGRYEVPFDRVIKCFDGEWSNNSIVTGTLTLKFYDFSMEPAVFKGTFKNMQPFDGSGVIRTDKLKFEGKIKNGKPYNGKGIYTDESDNAYTGTWEEGRFTGQCNFNNGNKYIGAMADGQCHGKGKMIYKDGSEYDGGWEKGQMHGHGSKKFANRNVYTGGWSNGKMHGAGKYTWTDQYITYDGKFSNDELDQVSEAIITNENRGFKFQKFKMDTDGAVDNKTFYTRCPVADHMGRFSEGRVMYKGGSIEKIQWNDVVRKAI